jgi:hypothetical protein
MAAKVSRVTSTASVLLAACLAFSVFAPTTAVAASKMKTADSPQGRWYGVYMYGVPGSFAPLAPLQAALGRTAQVVQYFDDEEPNTDFNPVWNGNVAGNGSIPMVTMQLWDYRLGPSQPAYSLSAICAGAYDAFLLRWATAAKAYGGQVWLRPEPEMNGDWSPWCGTVNGNTPAQFVAAWKHIYNIFSAAGASNVKFVWSPNATSVPNTRANAISAYWPGDAYVDYIGIDGYNWGRTATTKWTSFSGVFGAAYATVTSLSSSKPIVLTEIGCSETGGSKAAWITDMFRVIPASFPRIAGLVWFDANKEADWRIESSAASLAAFKAGLASF